MYKHLSQRKRLCPPVITDISYLSTMVTVTQHHKKASEPRDPGSRYSRQIGSLHTQTLSNKIIETQPTKNKRALCNQADTMNRCLVQRQHKCYTRHDCSTSTRVALKVLLLLDPIPFLFIRTSRSSSTGQTVKRTSLHPPCLLPIVPAASMLADPTETTARPHPAHPTNKSQNTSTSERSEPAAKANPISYSTLPQTPSPSAKPSPPSPSPPESTTTTSPSKSTFSKTSYAHTHGSFPSSTTTPTPLASRVSSIYGSTRHTARLETWGIMSPTEAISCPKSTSGTSSSRWPKLSRICITDTQPASSSLHRTGSPSSTGT